MGGSLRTDMLGDGLGSVAHPLDRPVAGAGQGVLGRVNGWLRVTQAMISSSGTAWDQRIPAGWKPRLERARQQSLKRVFLLGSGTRGT